MVGCALLLDPRFFHVLHKEILILRLTRAGETHRGSDLATLQHPSGVVRLHLIMRGLKDCGCGRKSTLSEWRSVIFPPHEVAPCPCRSLDLTSETGQVYYMKVRKFRVTDTLRISRIWVHLTFRLCFVQGILLKDVLHRDWTGSKQLV